MLVRVSEIEKVICSLECICIRRQQLQKWGENLTFQVCVHKWASLKEKPIFTVSRGARTKVWQRALLSLHIGKLNGQGCRGGGAKIPYLHTPLRIVCLRQDYKKNPKFEEKKYVTASHFSPLLTHFPLSSLIFPSFNHFASFFSKSDQNKNLDQTFYMNRTITEFSNPSLLFLLRTQNSIL